MDDTSIKFNAKSNAFYAVDGKNSSDRSSRSGKADGKDFKRLLGKSEQDEKARKQIKRDEEPEDGQQDINLLEEDSGEIASTPPPSLFEMSKANSPKMSRQTTVSTQQSFQAALSDQHPQVAASNQHSLNIKNEALKSESAATQRQGETAPSSDLEENDHYQLPVNTAVTSDDPRPKKDGSNDNSNNQSNSSVTIHSDHVATNVESPKKPVIPPRPFDLITHNDASLTQTSRIDQTPILKKQKETSLFNQAQAEVNSTNPLAAAPQTFNINQNLDTKATAPLPSTRSIQELINQMVKEIQSMETAGKTDTTITLKHPPMFENAQLTVTSFGNARGEFNISFENLTPAAQAFLSAQQTRESLISSLEQKGYHIHIMHASTIDQQRTYTTNIDASHRERDQNQDEQGQGRSNKDNEEEA